MLIEVLILHLPPSRTISILCACTHVASTTAAVEFVLAVSQSGMSHLPPGQYWYKDLYSNDSNPWALARDANNLRRTRNRRVAGGIVCSSLVFILADVLLRVVKKISQSNYLAFL